MRGWVTYSELDDRLSILDLMDLHELMDLQDLVDQKSMKKATEK